jgi:hypothetical protein|tara:strand:+ start:213 stop:416 length:204 start_codon:yes stop_codon:yes gene_type:complete
MTDNTIQFTGKSLRSKEDLERLIKDAKWQVDYYSKDVQKAQDNLYIRQLALECLENELNIVNDVSEL